MAYSRDKGFTIDRASVDGVTVKVGEKFLPPEKVTMPLNLTVAFPTEALFMEYDFNLENKVLEWTVQRKQMQEAATAAIEKMKAVAKANEPPADKNVTTSDEPSDIASDKPNTTFVNSVPVSTNAATPNFADLSGGAILKPTPISTTNKSSTVASAQNNPAAFDLADFEQVQDPFENMELQVLDDMAELNKVLQGSQASDAKQQELNKVLQGSQASDAKHESTQAASDNMPHLPATESPSQSTDTVAHSLKNVDYPDIDSIGSESSVSLHASGAVAFFKPQTEPVNKGVFPLHSQPLPPIPTSSSLVQQPLAQPISMATYNISQNFAQPVCPSGEQSSAQWDSFVNTPCKNANVNRSNNTSLNGFVSNLNSVKLKSGVQTSCDGLRNARSTPDIPGLLGEHEYARPTSHTPPPFRTKTPPPKPSIKQPDHHALPDPYRQMSPDSQRFVDNITDMGFTRARVARAVQKLGHDDKQVLDHLCAITRLQEAGFAADLSETALQQFENQSEQAQQYLKLLVQFKEFGFKEDKVRDALIKNNLDEDKTLDCLTSS